MQKKVAGSSILVGKIDLVIPSKNDELIDSLRRLLISQDRHAIFLTLAKYNESYVKYLKGEYTAMQIPPVRNLSFLTMQEYGPWVINNHKLMEDLAKIIVSFCLEVTSDINQANERD